MFKDRKTLEVVVIELDLDKDTVLFYYKDYFLFLKMGWLFKIYNDLKNDFPLFIYLYKRIKKDGLNKKDITTLLKSQQELKFMEYGVELYTDIIREQQ